MKVIEIVNPKASCQAHYIKFSNSRTEEIVDCLQDWLLDCENGDLIEFCVIEMSEEGSDKLSEFEGVIVELKSDNPIEKRQFNESP